MLARAAADEALVHANAIGRGLENDSLRSLIDVARNRTGPAVKIQYLENVVWLMYVVMSFSNL